MWNVRRLACGIGALGITAGGCAPAAQKAGPTEAHEAAPAAPVQPTAAPAPSVLNDTTIIPLASMRKDAASFAWFQFKPGVRKLILSGAPDSRHVSVLWYGYEGEPGAVPMHYHEKTESIFVIDGAQSDAKGKYPKGSFYFNPPTSGHQISDSAGLFLLSYAAPPDFKRTDEIKPYENLVIGTDYAKLPFATCDDGSLCYALPLAESGGMLGRFVKPQASGVALSANLLIVLSGSCAIEGQVMAADTLLVHKTTEPAAYRTGAADQDCLLYTMAFL